MKPYIFLSFLSCLWATLGLGQIVLLNENFENGLPQGWTMEPAQTWTIASNSIGNTNAVSRVGNDSAWLHTPFVDLSSVVAPELSLSFAMVTGAFTNPAFAIWYDDGTGWQLLEDWGVFNQINTISVPFAQDPSVWVPDSADVYSVNIDLASLAANNNVRFALGLLHEFQANQSRLLIDNILIQGETPVGIATNTSSALELRLFPQPVTQGTLSIQSASPITSVHVFSLSGALVAQVNQAPTTLLQADVRHLPAGLYSLQIITKTGLLTEKLVVAK